MEIQDYLRALAKRKWVVILIPLVVGALTLGYALSKPPSWVGSATVTAHPSSAAAGSVVQYINSYVGAMSADSVINEVAQQTGVSPDSVRAGLGAQPIGANSLILKVTYTGKDKAKVTNVALAAARDTLVVLAEPSLTSAEATLNAEQAYYEQTKTAVDNYVKAGGPSAPLDTYQAQESTLAQLQVAYQLAVLAKQSTAPGLKALVDAQQQRVNSLSQSVDQGQRLANAEVRASINVADANKEFADAQAQLATANDPAAVVAGYTTKASRLSDIIKLVGPLVVVALVVVIGAIVIRENRRYRRQHAEPAS